MIDNAQYIISEHILNQETQQAIEFIRNGKVNIMQLYDDKKQTVLVDNIELTLFLAEYATQHYTQAEVVKWVNKFNIDLFAPLHQASYNGCFECANILLGVQANPNLNSGYGLLPIHAAAQGDSPCMIKYWLEKGFDVDVPDSEGNTCLHWAVYNNCEQTVNFLIAWGAKLDQLNNKKQTALHLAVVSMANKIIRKLLIRNADRNIKDSAGKLPLDYAIENEYFNIAKMIEDPINLNVICNLKQPYHRVDRNLRSVMIFLVIFISSNAMILNNDFVQDNQMIFILQLSIACITLLLFIWISHSDAGVLNQKLDLDSAFFECKYDASKLCPDCQLLKPPRSKHCEICKKCVMVYDHHCPWVNNCIGAKNFKIFYTFISTLIIDEVLGLALIITSIITRDFTLMNIITYGYPCAIIGFFLVPTLLLLFYQTKNIFQGITTYERITNSQQTLQKSALIPEVVDYIKLGIISFWVNDNGTPTR